MPDSRFCKGLSERLSSLLGTKVSEQDLKTHHSREWLSPRQGVEGGDEEVRAAAASQEHRSRDDCRHGHGVELSGRQSASFNSSVAPPASGRNLRLPFRRREPALPAATGNISARASGAENRAGDAGPQLLFTGPNGTQTLNQLSNGEYRAFAGTGFDQRRLTQGNIFGLIEWRKKHWRFHRQHHSGIEFDMVQQNRAWVSSTAASR